MSTDQITEQHKCLYIEWSELHVKTSLVMCRDMYIVYK